MQKLKLYNSLNRKLEEFKPIDENKIGMYTCGITVYDKCHLGHGKTYICSDILFRVLKELYKNVVYVRNITDVDDKINKRAVERGITIQELTRENIKLMNDDFKYLHLLNPTVEPKATEHIKDMISIIQKLIDNGNAYVAEGHVLFDTTTYKDYGKLSGRDTEDMIAGARIEVAPYKKNPMDFVLWKPSLDIDDDSSKFESPWSIGRPGWHIECSAMSYKYLGESFDIHCGGNDLKFPHHENEIAQSRCAFKGSNFANYWVHVGFLLVNGEKMSKSLHNFTTIEDLKNQGIKGVAIRYAFLKNHYRTPFDFSMKLVEEADKNLTDLHKAIKDIKASEKLNEKVLEYLCDDLNTSKVLAELHTLKNTDLPALKKAMEFLDIYDESYYQENKDLSNLNITEDEILTLINERLEAKKNKDFKKADEIRNLLDTRGILLKDTPSGSEWNLK
ncbi:MAG TPA: cysteine--tRNA ligase [Rickettsiales bacterium]|nr:cysteine--tRNA ligase [Rickettsiales bacterium]